MYMYKQERRTFSHFNQDKSRLLTVWFNCWLMGVYTLNSILMSQNRNFFGFTIIQIYSCSHWLMTVLTIDLSVPHSQYLDLSFIQVLSLGFLLTGIGLNTNKLSSNQLFSEYHSSAGLSWWADQLFWPFSDSCRSHKPKEINISSYLL